MLEMQKASIETVFSLLAQGFGGGCGGGQGAPQGGK